jgi:protein-disulfide isomerase
MVLVSVAAVLVGAVLIFLALPKGASNGGDELLIPTDQYPAALVAGDVVGAADAPVVIELYADFQCPACKSFVTGRLARLVDEFVVPGTVRIEAKDVDFLGRGTPSESLELAAGARCAAEQGRYWQYHDIVFWNQGRENRGDHDAAFIGRVADAARLDRTAFDACFARPDVRDPIRAQTAAAAQQGIQYTPTLIVNGQRMVGVPEYAQLQSLIQQLAAAATAPAS